MFKNGYLKSFIKAELIEILLIFLFAVIMQFTELGEKAISAISYLIVAVKAYAFAYIQTQVIREFGYRVGLKCGIISFIFYFLISLITKSGFSSKLIIKFIISLVCGTVGGVVGVNSDKTKL